MLALALILVFLHPAMALADAMNSGWSYTLACPNYDHTGSSGTLTVTNVDGFTCNGGCGTCSRMSNSRFQQISFSGATVPGGVTLNSTTLYALNIGKFLLQQ